MRAVLLWLFWVNLPRVLGCHTWQIQKVYWHQSECDKVRLKYEKLHSNDPLMPQSDLSNFDDFFFASGHTVSNAEHIYENLINSNNLKIDTDEFLGQDGAPGRCVGYRFMNVWKDGAPGAQVYNSFENSQVDHLVSFVNDRVQLNPTYFLDSNAEQVLRLYYAYFENEPYKDVICAFRPLDQAIQPSPTTGEDEFSLDNCESSFPNDFVYSREVELPVLIHINPSPLHGDFLGRYTGSIELGVAVVGQSSGAKLLVEGKCKSRNNIDGYFGSARFDTSIRQLYFAFDVCGPLTSIARLIYGDDDKLAYPKCVDSRYYGIDAPIATRCWSPEFVSNTGRYCYGKVSPITAITRVCNEPPNSPQFPNGVSIPSVADQSLCCESNSCHRDTRRYIFAGRVPTTQEHLNHGFPDGLVHRFDHLAGKDFLTGPQTSDALSVDFKDGNMANGIIFLQPGGTPIFELDYQELHMCEYLQVNTQLELLSGEKIASSTQSWHVGVYQGLTITFFAPSSADINMESFEDIWTKDPIHKVYRAYENIDFDEVHVGTLLEKGVSVQDTIPTSHVAIVISAHLKKPDAESSCFFRFRDNADRKAVVLGGHILDFGVDEKEYGQSVHLESEYVFLDIRYLKVHSSEFTLIMEWTCPNGVENWKTDNKLFYERIQSLGPFPQLGPFLRNGETNPSFGQMVEMPSPVLELRYRTVERESFFNLQHDRVQTAPTVIKGPLIVVDVAVGKIYHKGCSPFIWVSLSRQPASTVIVTISSGPYTVDKCSLTFTMDNFNVRQRISWADTVLSRVSPGEILFREKVSAAMTIVTPSNDCQGWLALDTDSSWLFLDANPVDPELEELGCFVSMDGSLRSYSVSTGSLIGSSPIQLTELDRTSVLFGSQFFTVQANVASCSSGVVCVVAASVQFYDDVYSAYRVQDGPMTLYHKGFAQPHNPLLSVKVDDFGCWTFSTKCGIVTEFCVVDTKYLDIFISVPREYFVRDYVGLESEGLDNLSVRHRYGYCVNSQQSETDLKTSSSLAYFPQEDPLGLRSQFPDYNFNKFPIRTCGTPLDPAPDDDNNDDTFRNNIRSISSPPFPTNTFNFFSPVQHDSKPQSQGLYKTCKKLAVYMKNKFNGPEDWILSTTRGYRQLCHDLMNAGHEERNAVQSAKQLLYNVMRYVIIAEAWEDTGTFSISDHKSAFEANPHACGPRAKARRTGCKCLDTSSPQSFPNCEGPRNLATFNEPINPANRCTFSHSVLIDNTKGRVYKCFKGDCQYTHDKVHWIGLPKNEHTPYCLNAISWNDQDRKTGQKLWGTSEFAIQLMSDDGGFTWTVLPHAYDDDKFPHERSHHQFFSNLSPAVKGNPHEAPPNDGFTPSSFAGEGNDIWWLTPTELCVQSDSISAFHSAMISCSAWYCQCVNADAWIESFGISPTSAQE